MEGFLFDIGDEWSEGFLVQPSVEFAAGKGNKGRFDVLVWCQEKTINAIFDRAQSSIRKYHVEAFFLTMISVKFIVIERRGSELYWIIGKDGVGVLDSDAKFEVDINWKGIHVYPENTKWKFESRKK